MANIEVENIPDELKSLPQWVVWRYEERDGKITKVPIDAKTGSYAKCNDSQTWADFPTALFGARRFNCEGVGFVFTKDDRNAGVDIDNCYDPETGDIAPWAISILQSLNSYAEISPSGRGIKFFVQGKLEGSGKQFKVKDGRVEIYDRNRYFAVTGNHLPGTPGNILVADLPALVKKLSPNRTTPHTAQAAAGDDQEFTTRKQIFDEFKRRIASHESSVTRPDGTIHCQGICHAGKSTGKNGAIILFPNGAFKCMAGCSIERMVEAFGLPPLPDKPGRSPAETVDPYVDGPPDYWQWLDWANVEQWEVEEEVKIIDKILVKGNVCLIAAQSQTGKTLLGAYLAAAMVTGGKLFGEFEITKVPKVLYLVLEDPPRRIKKRLIDFAHEFSKKEPGRFILYFTPDLTIPEALPYLERVIKEHKFDVVFIDTYQKATPGVKSFDDEKQSLILHALASLRTRTGSTLMVQDHLRKQQGNSRRRNQELDLDDIKGTGGKVQNADVVILMDRCGSDKDQLRVKVSSKDFDRQLYFLLQVSPQGSTEPKFKFLGHVKDLAQAKAKKSEQSKAKVLEAVPDNSWISQKDIRSKTGFSERKVRDDLNALIAKGLIEDNGLARSWKRYSRTGKNNSESKNAGSAGSQEVS
jgi:AAA domain